MSILPNYIPEILKKSISYKIIKGEKVIRYHFFVYSNVGSTIKIYVDPNKIKNFEDFVDRMIDFFKDDENQKNIKVPSFILSSIFIDSEKFEKIFSSELKVKITNKNVITFNTFTNNYREKIISYIINEKIILEKIPVYETIIV